MNVSKRNHYLPQFYLNNFMLNNESHFWVYYKGKDDPIPQTPINTGIETNLYNIKGQDDIWDDSVEKKLFAPIDGIGSTVISRIIESKYFIEKDDFNNMALFLSFMATIVPRTIQAVREFAESLVTGNTRELVKDKERFMSLLDDFQKEKPDYQMKISPEEMFEFVKDIENRAKLTVNKKFATGMSISSYKPILDEILKMNWCICRAPSELFFITSDCPCVPFILNADGSAIIVAGFGQDNVEITFPLTPSICLYLSKKPMKRYRAIHKNLVKEFNKRTAYAANKFIVSHIKCKYVLGINKWASKSLDHPLIDKEKCIETYGKKIDIFKD